MNRDLANFVCIHIAFISMNYAAKSTAAILRVLDLKSKLCEISRWCYQEKYW